MRTGLDRGPHEFRIGVGVSSLESGESRAYFLEGSATTDSPSAGRMRVRRSCQYFSGRSTVQSAYHRVSSVPRPPLRLHDDSTSRRWVTLASGRPCSSSCNRSVSVLLASCLLPPAACLRSSSFSSSYLSCFAVPTRTRPRSRVLASPERHAREGESTERHSLIPASGTWNRIALCFPSQRIAAIAPSFSRGRSAPSRWSSGRASSGFFFVPGRSRNVVMAGTSRRPSSELGPDLSSPTPPKKSKFSEASIEGTTKKEHDLSTEELESVEKLASSVAASLSGNTIELISGDASEPNPFEISEESLDSTKQLIQTSLEGPANVTAGCSKDEHFGSFETIVQMKYSGQEGHSGSSSKRSESDSDVQIKTSLLGEDALYQELSLIGNGAYGIVYKAKDLNTGQVVALKKVRVPLTEDGLPTSTLREITTLKQLERFEHPHIVRLLDVCQGNYLHLPSVDGRSERLDRGLTLWLVFEHVERDLASYMSSCPPTGISPHLLKQMSKEILKGVEFLHSHRIIHRDLKPQNLLVSREGRIKIADFGLAKTYDFEMRLTSVVVTQWYRAPEVLLGCSYATPVDVWSVGCILAELSRLEPLFPGTSEGDQLDRIFQIIGTPSQEEWPENVSLSWTAFPHRQPKPLGTIIPDLNEHGLDLITSMLTFDPHTRLTAARALRHRYFAEDDS